NVSTRHCCSVLFRWKRGGVGGEPNLTRQHRRSLGRRRTCRALGALPRDVLLLTTRQGATLALGGIVLGSLGAIASTRWMRSMLFQVDPLDPVTFVAVGVALAAVAVGAAL